MEQMFKQGTGCQPRTLPKLCANWPRQCEAKGHGFKNINEIGFHCSFHLRPSAAYCQKDKKELTLREPATGPRCGVPAQSCRSETFSVSRAQFCCLPRPPGQQLFISFLGIKIIKCGRSFTFANIKNYIPLNQKYQT